MYCKIILGEPGYVKGGYKVGQMEEPAFIHSTSVLKKVKPDWIIYQVKKEFFLNNPINISMDVLITSEIFKGK